MPEDWPEEVSSEKKEKNRLRSLSSKAKVYVWMTNNSRISIWASRAYLLWLR